MSSSESEPSSHGVGMAAANVQLTLGVATWGLCSVGMLVFNKLAIKAFPIACTLVALQFGFSVLVMLCCWRSIHIGSKRDVLRWCMVVPFFTGMILSSILALKYAPMTLVMTFRALSPLVSLGIERLYPSPLQVSPGMVVSLVGMLAGVALYLYDMDHSNLAGAGWALLNNFLAVGDRLLQRLMLGSDQEPVDISKTGVTLLNNLLGMLPLLAAALLTNEFAAVPAAVAKLGSTDVAVLAASCVVGVGISYTGIWVQTMISATSFLVLINASKFIIIFIEAFCMREKSLGFLQILGAFVSILAAIAYGRARGAVEAEEATKKAEVAEDEELQAAKLEG